MRQLFRLAFRPSLARRVVLALIAAFGLVFAVLAAREYWAPATDELSVVDRALKNVGDGFANAFDGIPDETRAADVALALDTLLNDPELAPDDRLTAYWKLLNASGEPVYSSGAIDGMQFDNAPGQFATLDGDGGTPLAGRQLRVYRSDTKPWSILIAIESPGNPTLLRWYFGDMLESLLIAFPLVLVPILVAVLTGLRPLRQLSRHLERRDVNELTPLGINPRQSELQPVVFAIDTLLARLKAGVEQEKAFVQDAAHELQTPLAGISTQAHVLSVASSPEERAQARQRMERIIERASHVVRQLLQLARLDSRALAERSTVDLAQAVREKLMQSALPALSRHIELSLDAPESLPLEIELPMFRSILDNLLDNALRYVPAGGHVHVDLQAAGGWLSLRVADDGPGIPPDERERVFDRFYRVPGQDIPGSGLGLAIARQAATQLGGSLALGPGLEGRGCGFDVRLPVAGTGPHHPA
jgi:two-component system sensor histidine kinase QseC